VHDALEKEFGIEIKDRQVLITDIDTAFYVVMSHHDPI
jgi:acyl carrier protein